MTLVRQYPALAFLVLLAVLGLTGVIGEPAWFVAVGAFALIQLVLFMIRLEREGSRR